MRLLTESNVKLYYSRSHVLFGTCQNEEQPSDVSATANSVRDVKHWVRATSAMRGLFLRVKMGERTKTINQESREKRQVLVDMPELSSGTELTENPMRERREQIQY